MAKFLKSIFHPNDRKKSPGYDSEDDKDDFTPPMDGRRKLSISRSGRMKQAHKKRNSLSLEIYGGENLQNQKQERPKTMEYHVKPPAVKKTDKQTRRHSSQSIDNEISKQIERREAAIENREAVKVKETKTPENEQIKTPEEEIDNAFDILDKT